MLAKKSINIIKGLVSVIIAMAMFIAMGKDNVVYAASATVTISSATVTQGQEVKVNIEISADANIGAYNFYLEYDASVLEAVSGFEGGGGGRIQVLYDVPDEASLSKKITKTITFKAIGPGTTEIKYVCIKSDDGVIDYDTIDNMAVTSKNGTVKVNPPVIASKNNNLSSMAIAAVRADGSSYDVPLSPAFSKDVTKYNISVEEGVTKLVVSAKTEDAKAKIYVQWANLDPGENTTKVIVTAEDGSKKEYVIYTAVPVPETTTPAPVEPIVTVVDGVEYFVENINDATVLPEGFEAVDYEYEGKTVVVGKGLVKDLIVMYLTTGTGEAGKLFIYDEVAKNFYPMANVAMSQKLYTIVKAPEGLVIPAGFTESMLTIDGVELLGWQTEEIEGVYLVYAMNWEGKSGLYYYDTSESQMIKYFETSVEVGVGLDEYNKLVTENESLKNEVSKLQNEDNDVDGAKTEMYKYGIFVALAVIVILLGIILVLVLMNKKDEIETEDENNDAMDTAFANIVSREEAEVASKSDDEEDEEEYEDEEDMPVVGPEVLPETDDESTEGEETKSDNGEEVDESDQFEDFEDDEEDDEEFDEDFDGGYDEEDYDDYDEEDYDEAVEEPVEEAAEEVDKDSAENVDDISAALASELQSAVADIFAEETVEEVVEETVEESEEEVSEESAEEPEEEIVEETVEEVSDEPTEEAVEQVEDIEEKAATEEKLVVENKNTEKSENRKRVKKILQDENTSIKEDELDMVIDELFDDLFGE